MTFSQSQWFNMDAPKYELTPKQIEQITALVERNIASIVRDAVLKVVGHQCKKSKTKTKPSDERLADKIVHTLTNAPTIASQYPDIQQFLELKAMPKTLLRRLVGNSHATFGDVLESMVVDGRLIYRKLPGTKGRYLHLYGLP